MRKPLILLLLLSMVSACLAGCSRQMTPAPSASPSATVEPSKKAETPDNSASSVYTTVGENAVLQAAGKDLKEKAYYDAEGRLLVPIKPVMEALGWKADGPGESGAAHMTLTLEHPSTATGGTTPALEMLKEAEEDAKVQSSPSAEKSEKQEVVLRFTIPAGNENTRISDVVVSKNGKDLKIVETLPWIDGMLYATQEWLETVFETLSIEYDGEKIISVTRKA